MIPLSFSRKVALLKAQNHKLYYFLLFLLVFTYGIVLIFSPLPGYLLLKSSPLTFPFWLGLGFFVVIAFVCIHSFLFFWTKAEILFFYQWMGKSKTKLHLLKVLLPFSWIYFVLLFAAFLQVNFQWQLQFLVYLLTGVGLFLGTFLYLLKQKLRRRRCTPIFGKHVRLLWFLYQSGGCFRLLLQSVCLMFGVVVYTYLNHQEWDINFQLILFLVSICFCRSTISTLSQNLDNVTYYLQSMGDPFTYRIKMIAYMIGVLPTCIQFIVLGISL